MSSELPMYERIPAKTAYETFRDTAYSTDKAIAEIVDNSIQANADDVLILVIESEQLVNQRRRSRVREIYVCDNGVGMNPEVLTYSLGVSSGLNRNDPSGMGKFGWGLVGSTLSQCRRVDIWSWQAGITNSYRTSLDLDDNEMTNYLNPAEQGIPPQEIIKYLDFPKDTSGTIVRWSKLDRIDWVKASSIAKNTAEILGRLYRKLLNDRTLKFRVVDTAGNPHDFHVVPTDPLYLLEGIHTTTPSPYSHTALFEEAEGSPLSTAPIRNSENQTLPEIEIRFSAVKEEIYKQTSKSGNEPYGKHANRHKGVSLIRAGRELLLDDDWCNDTRDRWWGIEVCFQPIHDEIFGVGKDKQSARVYAEVAHQYKRFINDPEEWISYKESFEEGTPFASMCVIVNEIAQISRKLNRKIRNYKAGTGTKRPGEEGVPLTPIERSEEQATKVSKLLAKETPVAGIDDYSEPKETARQELKEALIASGQEPSKAETSARETIEFERKFKIITSQEDSDAFFSVKDAGGVILLAINVNHSFNESLIQLLLDDSVGSDNDQNLEPVERIKQLENRIDEASVALLCTLASWARMEYEANEATTIPLRKARQIWGHYAEQFLQSQ